MSERASSTYKSVWIIILASLSFFCVRAIQYALIGSHAPLGIAMISAVMIIAAFAFGKTGSRKALKLFGILLIFYGTIRVLLGLLLKIAPIDSAHASEATSASYFLISALFLFGGVYLFKHSAFLKP